MSDVHTANAPAAGWYPDPGEPSVLRYWDGAQWTHHLQPAPQPVETTSRPDWLTNRAAIGAVLGLMAIATLVFVLIGGGGDSETGGDATSVGSDADAMAFVTTARTAIETFSTDNDGSYAATAEDLVAIEPLLPAGALTVEAQPQAFVVTVQSDSGVAYSISRDPAGTVNYTCTPTGEGDCPDSGVWNSG